MSKTVKIVILILSILPIFLFLGGYFGFIFGIIGWAARHPGAHQSPPLGMIFGFMSGMMLAYMLGLGMMVFYIINIIVTNKVPKDLKPIWGILLFVGLWISWIVYWFFYIWPEPVNNPEVTASIMPPVERHGEA